MQDIPVSLANVKDKDVTFIKERYYQGLFATDKNLQKEITRKYFSEEYQLLTAGKPIEYQIINGCPWMELEFCKGKLIHKRLPYITRNGLAYPQKIYSF